MNALREQQAPIKAKYKEYPESAVITHHGEGELAPAITCNVQTHIGIVPAGLHAAAGGTGEHACSGDMLLQALAACAGVTCSCYSDGHRASQRNRTCKRTD
jgi:hypothetical protein